MAVTYNQMNYGTSFNSVNTAAVFNGGNLISAQMTAQSNAAVRSSQQQTANMWNHKYPTTTISGGDTGCGTIMNGPPALKAAGCAGLAVGIFLIAALSASNKTAQIVLGILSGLSALLACCCTITAIARDKENRPPVYSSV